MKLSRFFPALLLSMGCIGTMQSAAALTVGKVRGGVFLGKVLNISVPLQLAEGEDVGDLCPDVDVYLGDSLVESSRTSVAVESASLATGGGAQLRIQSSARVDEPVVTVFLRTGCRQASTRKFVLLADMAPEPTEAAPEPLRAPVAAKPAAPQGDPNVVVGTGTARAVVEGRSLAQPPLKRIKKNPGVAQPPSANSKPKVVSESGKGRARLEVLPLDLTMDWEPTLKVGSLEISTPTEDPQRRAQAAALWRALNASAEDVLRASGQLDGLEKNLQTLSGQIQRNQQLLTEMEARVRAAQEERFHNPLVWTLGGLVFVLAALAVFLWRGKTLDAPPWWTPASGHTLSKAAVAAEAPTKRTPEPKRAMPAAVASVPPPDSQIDIALSDSGFSVQTGATAPRTAPGVTPSRFDGPPSGHSDFAHSVTGSLRAINTQELVDVRQQADFFLALGQHDEAIRVLQNGIGQSGDSNPLIFLDLVAILHNLGRREEYEQVRTTFNALYTGHVPAFAEYTAHGDGLLAYQGICDHIAELWPTDWAMEFIEHCLVRDATDSADRGFELSAFRDLLMLHGIVGKIVVPHSGGGAVQMMNRQLPVIAISADPELDIVTRSGAL